MPIERVARIVAQDSRCPERDNVNRRHVVHIGQPTKFGLGQHKAEQSAVRPTQGVPREKEPHATRSRCTVLRQAADQSRPARH